MSIITKSLDWKEIVLLTYDTESRPLDKPMATSVDRNSKKPKKSEILMSSTIMLHGFKVSTFQNSKKAYETYEEINTNYIGEKENSKETLSQRN